MVAVLTLVMAILMEVVIFPIMADILVLSVLLPGAAVAAEHLIITSKPKKAVAAAVVVPEMVMDGIMVVANVLRIILVGADMVAMVVTLLKVTILAAVAVASAATVATKVVEQMPLTLKQALAALVETLVPSLAEL